MPRTDIVAGEVFGRVMAMASEIRVRAVTRGVDPKTLHPVVDAALDVFRVVQVACTRFDPDSPLMQANARPDDWVRVHRVCLAALTEAHRAYVTTAGRFDPRVLDDLVRLGYARSMRTGVPAEIDAPEALCGRSPLPEWRPAFRDETSEVRLGGHPVDLGGIGKGLAVRWCAARLLHEVEDFLVEAGGDCYCAGRAPDGAPWHIAVEDPAGGDQPVAVLALTDLACATSSVRVRRWRVAGGVVHHLVDPRTGLPGGAGLQSVTVVDPDPANAEVWSKALFLSGVRDIAADAERRRVAALWVTDDATPGFSPAMSRYVVWQSS